jgi:Flp pilus assembly protein TadG
MVEFALIVPMLVVLLVGIIEFGAAYNTQLTLQAAAREGARAAALGRARADIADRTRDAAGPYGDDVDVDLSRAICPPTTDPWDDREARVTVSTDYTFEIPFVSLGTVELSATGVMRCGV